jgi:CMP-N,N'-diacetyllegionaminic acid synthase
MGLSMSGRCFSIIPARAGSKRLPGKNGLDLCGLPMFGWSIKASVGCSKVEQTFFSTDSLEYKKTAESLGALCPKLRSDSLSSDDATSADVVMDVLDNFIGCCSPADSIVLLQPTSPLRNSDDISQAINLHVQSGAPAVVSVCEAECPRNWLGRFKDGLSMEEFVEQNPGGKRSQDLDRWYRVNGAIYIVGVETFRRERTFLPKGTIAYKMPRERSVDVDTKLDFEIACYLMTRNVLNNKKQMGIQ